MYAQHGLVKVKECEVPPPFQDVFFWEEWPKEASMVMTWVLKGWGDALIMVGGNGMGLVVLSSSLIEHGVFGGYKVDS